jgi:hypothetical protein
MFWHGRRLPIGLPKQRGVFDRQTNDDRKAGRDQPEYDNGIGGTADYQAESDIISLGAVMPHRDVSTGTI